MLETASTTEMRQHYQRAHALRAQAFRKVFTLRWLRAPLTKRAAKKRAAQARPVLQSCPT